MGIKKKLGLGVASAALGISLVGGGTWAAFNDVETLSAKYAAGTLDLSVEHKVSTLVNLSNLKPGDVFEKEFTLKNIGSLAIKDVLLKLGYSEFQDADGGTADTDAYEFLKQFKISVLSMDKLDGTDKLVESKEIVKDKNLYDFYVDTNKTDGRVSVVTKTGNEYNGLPVDPVNTGNLKFIIEFIDDPEKDEETGLYVQNKYQGNSIKLDFNFEAIQWNGLTIKADHVNDNGYISQNEKANSEDSIEGDNPGGEAPGEENPPVVIVLQSAKVASTKYTETSKNVYTLTTTALFTFKNGEKTESVRSVPVEIKNLSNGQSKQDRMVKFSVEYEGKTYERELLVKGRD